MGAILRSNADNVTKAAQALLAGELVIIPTETVYGLAADATQDLAVAKIFALKNRPFFNPLIIHVATVEAARQLVIFNQAAEILATNFWPGPLTMVLPKIPSCPISHLASAGLETLAVRIPNHQATLGLLKKVARPLAAPSANRSQTLSPTTAADADLATEGRCSLILDAGPCAIGLESTIVDLTTKHPCVLRPGGLPAEALALCIEITPGDIQVVKAPGMLKRHYAPQTPLRLEATHKLPGEVMLGFGAHSAAELNLSSTANLQEAAANLFRMLRTLDCMQASAIAVMPIPRTGLGIAINDRLQRAAYPDKYC